MKMRCCKFIFLIIGFYIVYSSTINEIDINYSIDNYIKPEIVKRYLYGKNICKLDDTMSKPSNLDTELFNNDALTNKIKEYIESIELSKLAKDVVIDLNFPYLLVKKGRDIIIAGRDSIKKLKRISQKHTVLNKIVNNLKIIEFENIEKLGKNKYLEKEKFEYKLDPIFTCNFIKDPIIIDFKLCSFGSKEIFMLEKLRAPSGSCLKKFCDLFKFKADEKTLLIIENELMKYGIMIPPIMIDHISSRFMNDPVHLVPGEHNFMNRDTLKIYMSHKNKLSPFTRSKLKEQYDTKNKCKDSEFLKNEIELFINRTGKRFEPYFRKLRIYRNTIEIDVSSKYQINENDKKSLSMEVTTFDFISYLIIFILFNLILHDLIF